MGRNKRVRVANPASHPGYQMPPIEGGPEHILRGLREDDKIKIYISVTSGIGGVKRSILLYHRRSSAWGMGKMIHV